MTYHYDDYYDNYNDYDPRTWNEKYHDDNTWRKDRGIFTIDGIPELFWCEEEKKVVEVRLIEGSTVFDRYEYFVCASCGVKENRLREPTDEELDMYDGLL